MDDITVHPEKQRHSQYQTYLAEIAAVIAVLGAVAALLTPEIRHRLLRQTRFTIHSAKLFSYTYVTMKTPVDDPTNPSVDEVATAVNENLSESLGLVPSAERRNFEANNHFIGRRGDRLYLEVTLLHDILQGKHSVSNSVTYHFPTMVRLLGGRNYDVTTTCKTHQVTFDGSSTKLIVPLDALGNDLAGWPKGRYGLSLSVDLDGLASQQQFIEFSID